MIILTREYNEKIELLDKLFGAFDVRQLKEFAESEEVVAKLKGTNNNPGILKSIVQEHHTAAMNIQTLNIELSILKSDLGTLIRAVADPNDIINRTTFAALKIRHGIY